MGLTDVGGIVFYGAVGLVLGGLALATVWGRDFWPFSHYPMFAGQTVGNAVRFFDLLFCYPSGVQVRLAGPAAAMADEVHREFERRWSASAGPGFDATDAVLKFWREACRFDRALVEVARIELRMRVAQIVDGGEVVVAEKSLQVVTTTAA